MHCLQAPLELCSTASTALRACKAQAQQAAQACRHARRAARPTTCVPHMYPPHPPTPAPLMHRSNVCPEGTERAGHFDPSHIPSWQNTWLLFCFMLSGGGSWGACTGRIHPQLHPSAPVCAARGECDTGVAVHTHARTHTCHIMPRAAMPRPAPLHRNSRPPLG